MSFLFGVAFIIISILGWKYLEYRYKDWKDPCADDELGLPGLVSVSDQEGSHLIIWLAIMLPIVIALLPFAKYFWVKFKIWYSTLNLPNAPNDK